MAATNRAGLAAYPQQSLPFDVAPRAEPPASASEPPSAGSGTHGATPESRSATPESGPSRASGRPEPVEAKPPHPDLVFTRHPKARRYILRVTDNGTVRVTVPRWGSKRDAEAFAAREHAWIEKQRQRIEQARVARPELVEQPSDAPAAAELRALRDRARQELPRRLLELAAAHGLPVARVSIRNQRWRWGSCSRSGHSCLNWRLVTMPDGVRDYVLIHELMHLKRMDHSPTFWKLVAAACPAYKEARAWLRSQGAR
jgi:predicted metal-dependent hydrolase